MASASSTIPTTPTCRTSIKQKALFGEASYKFSQFKLTAGGRWYDFHETRDFHSGGLFSNDDNRTDKTKSNGFSPRGILSWEPNRSLSVNVQAAKGFRLGGVNDPLNMPLCSGSDIATFGGFQTYKDETLWNYEAGVKYSKHGVTFNAAAFYNDIKNLQVTLDAGSCSSRIVFNVPKAHAEGIEAELSIHPLVGLDLSFAGSLLNSKFDSSVTSNGVGRRGHPQGQPPADGSEVSVGGDGQLRQPVQLECRLVRQRQRPADRQPLSPSRATRSRAGIISLDLVRSGDRHCPACVPTPSARSSFRPTPWSTRRWA